jgi:hypothetical protein
LLHEARARDVRQRSPWRSLRRHDVVDHNVPRILGEVGRAQSEYSSAGWVAVFVSLILDSGWAWAALAFALGWLTGTSARLADAARSGALSGATGLLVATPAYYATDLLFGIDGGSEIGYWVARALVFGLPLGVAGALARRPGPIGFLARLTVPVGTAMSMVMFPMRTGRPGESSAAIWAELTIWAAVVVVTFRLVWIQRRRRAHAVTAPKHASEATRTLSRCHGQ